MCDKIFDEIVNNIPTSTHKRKLYMNKLPLTAQSVSTINYIIIFYF